MVKKLIEFVVYSNVWVAAAVASLCALTGLIIGKQDYNLLAFSFFATLLMYAYSRWFSSPRREDEATSKLTDWTGRNRRIHIIIGLVGLAGSVWYLLKLNATTQYWLVGCAFISALYPLQFLKRGELALRNVAGLKLFVISAMWSVVTVVLPAVQVFQEWSIELGLLILQRFLFVMAITIPFDIRDLRIDHPDINTLPYRMGIKASRNFALLALLFAEAGAIVMFFSNTITLQTLVGQLIAFEIASLLIHRSTPKRPDLYFSFVVEGTSILLFLMVLILEYFWP